MLVSGPLMEAGGQSVAEGWQDLQRRSSRLASIDGEGEMLVRGLRAEPHPRLATDGRHLAYLQVDGKHPAQVVVRDLVTGRVVAHRTVNGSADFAWVNESLVVSQLDYGSPVELRSDLYWWTPGGTWFRLSRGGRLTRPFADPGGLAGAVAITSGGTSLVRRVPTGCRLRRSRRPRRTTGLGLRCPLMGPVSRRAGI